jgi:uncharacterized protein YkwD
MGRKRTAAVTAAVAAALLLAPALSGCTAAPSTPDRNAGPVAHDSGTPDGAEPTAAVRALATVLTSAFSSAATRAASVAATAAKSTSSHSVPPPSAHPSTRAAAAPSRPNTAPHAAPVGSGNSSLESVIFSMLNQERAQHGLPALQLTGSLTTSARRHSSAMAAAQSLSHQLPGEADQMQREAAAGYHGSAWAENVGETPQGNESGAVGLQNLLYGDPPHRANILSASMHAVGVGIVIDSRGQLWLTEDFGG